MLSPQRTGIRDSGFGVRRKTGIRGSGFGVRRKTTTGSFLRESQTPFFLTLSPTCFITESPIRLFLCESRTPNPESRLSHPRPVEIRQHDGGQLLEEWMVGKRAAGKRGSLRLARLLIVVTPVDGRREETISPLLNQPFGFRGPFHQGRQDVRPRSSIHRLRRFNRFKRRSCSFNLPNLRNLWIKSRSRRRTTDHRQIVHPACCRYGPTMRYFGCLAGVLVIDYDLLVLAFAEIEHHGRQVFRRDLESAPVLHPGACHRDGNLIKPLAVAQHWPQPRGKEGGEM